MSLKFTHTNVHMAYHNNIVYYISQQSDDEGGGGMYLAMFLK